MQMTPRRWRLRESTAALHAAVDARISGFDDLASYKSYLEALLRFRRPLEAGLAGATYPAGFGAWRPRAIAGAIEQDLRDLGDEPALADEVPPVLDGDRLYGVLYVLEGSSLGARVLYARARALDLDERHGARHLAALSDNLPGWRAFLARLEEADPFDIESAIEASLQAFDLARTAFEKQTP